MQQSLIFYRLTLTLSPAAADTIKCFLMDTKKKPSDFDVILTGDLGEVGSQLLIELLQKENINISCNHKDCGIMIFDKETQDTHAGGSGCGCSASVLCGYFMKRIKSESIKNLLFVGTGALMSPTLVNQSESIPAIAHSVWISSDTEG